MPREVFAARDATSICDAFNKSTRTFNHALDVTAECTVGNNRRRNVIRSSAMQI